MDMQNIKIKLDEIDQRLSALETGRQDLLSIEGIKEKVIHLEKKICNIERELINIKQELLKTRQESLALHEKILENLVNDSE